MNVKQHGQEIGCSSKTSKIEQVVSLLSKKINLEGKTRANTRNGSIFNANMYVY